MAKITSRPTGAMRGDDVAIRTRGEGEDAFLDHLRPAGCDGTVGPGELARVLLAGETHAGDHHALTVLPGVLEQVVAVPGPPRRGVDSSPVAGVVQPAGAEEGVPDEVVQEVELADGAGQARVPTEPETPPNLPLGQEAVAGPLRLPAGVHQLRVEDERRRRRWLREEGVQPLGALVRQHAARPTTRQSCRGSRAPG